MRTKHELILAEEKGDVIARYLLDEDENPWYVPAATVAYVLKRDNFKCKICRRTANLEIDHIVPTSKGGRCILSNLQVLCSWCNRAKSNHYLHPDSYERQYPIVIDTREYKLNQDIADLIELEYT